MQAFDLLFVILCCCDKRYKRYTLNVKHIFRFCFLFLRKKCNFANWNIMGAYYGILRLLIDTEIINYNI